MVNLDTVTTIKAIYKYLNNNNKHGCQTLEWLIIAKELETFFTLLFSFLDKSLDEPHEKNRTGFRYNDNINDAHSLNSSHFLILINFVSLYLDCLKLKRTATEQRK